MLIEPTHAKAEDISTHGFSSIMEDAIINDGDGKTTGMQSTSHNNSEDDVGVEKAENSQDVLTLSMDWSVSW